MKNIVAKYQAECESLLPEVKAKLRKEEDKLDPVHEKFAVASKKLELATKVATLGLSVEEIKSVVCPEEKTEKPKDKPREKSKKK